MIFWLLQRDDIQQENKMFPTSHLNARIIYQKNILK